MFLAVGLPGFLVAALLFTIREPSRQKREHQLPVAALVRWVVANKRTYAAAAAAEMVPRPLRAQGVSLFFLVRALIAQGLGPLFVALLTDHVFGEPGIRYSLLIVNIAAMAIALALLASGLGAYRRTLENRERWTDGSSPSSRA